MRIRSAAALVLLAVAACGGDKATGPQGPVAGSYTLLSVNGQRVPMTVSSSGLNKTEVLSGTFVVNTNSTFTEAVTIRESSSSLPPVTGTISCNGTYSQSGTTITFTEPETSNGDCGGTYTAMFSSGNTLAMTLGGTNLVYTK